MSTTSQLSGGSEPSSEVTEDELFEVLSNRRRRYAVHALKGADAPKELGTLAERVAAWEYDVDLDEVDHRQRKRVYTALQQSHLPKMDTAGVVDFDKQRGLVEPTEALADVDVYLEVVGGSEIPWSEYYLGLSGVSAALLAATWLGAWPFALLSPMAVALFVVVAFTVSALAHRYYSTTLGSTDGPPELER